MLESAPQILIREDHAAATRIQNALEHDGVDIVLNCHIQEARGNSAARILLLEVNGTKRELNVDVILVGGGHAPNVDGLNLETVNVQHDNKIGAEVDDRLQTTNPRIHAAGDICSQYKFTHMADALARIIIQNALFLGRAKAGALIPWCTYTDPEIAHVGLYKKEAEAKGIAVQTFIQELPDVDRAILDGETEGSAKAHVRKGADAVVGATIVARHAGEMISELTLAMAAKQGLKTLATVIRPSPPQAEAIRKTADA